MPMYMLSHTHKYTGDQTLITTDQPLPAHVRDFYDQENPGDDNPSFQALIQHLNIDFEPERGETLEVTEMADHEIKKVNVADLPPVAPDVRQYGDLYDLAEQYDNEWEANEGIDWNQAEDLVKQLEGMACEDKTYCPRILEILAYTRQNDEWDSGEVARFPQLIRHDLQSVDKVYSYRQTGDTWIVEGYHMTGEVDWVAEVDTETLAYSLVTTLQ